MDWCWIQAILSIMLLIPFSFGGLGIREGTLIGIFSYIGLLSEKALIISLTVFGLNIIIAIIGGLLELLRTIYKPTIN